MPLVEDLDAIRINIRELNDDLPNSEKFQQRLSKFNAFCVLNPEDEQPLFAPMRYVAQDGISIDRYLNRQFIAGSGPGDRVKELGMVKHVKGSNWYDILFPKLEEWHNRNSGTDPNKGAYFYTFPKTNHVPIIKRNSNKEGEENGAITNRIVFGPPGTGKTHLLRESLTKTNRYKKIEFVTFHQNYSYEDFIEGIRPFEDQGKSFFRLQSGIFKELCDEARQPENRDKLYAIIIDEINRGNITKIFGDVITLIEDNKRITTDFNGNSLPERKGMAPDGGITVTLPYSRKLFGIPANIDVFGTMNSADRSIALLDDALRRRFTFEEKMPDYEKLQKRQEKFKQQEEIDLTEMLKFMNARLTSLLDRNHAIGHSYFWHIETFRDLKEVLLHQIIPLLQEWLYNKWEDIRSVLADNKVRESNQIIIEDDLEKIKQKDKKRIVLFDGYDEAIIYRIRPISKITPTMIRKIYDDQFDIQNTSTLGE